MVISPWISLIKETFSDKSCKENKNILYVHFFLENLYVYETVQKSMVEPGKPQMTE